MNDVAVYSPPPIEPQHSSRKLLWIILVVIIVAVGLLVLFFRGRIGGLTSESGTAPLDSEDTASFDEGTFENDEVNYALPIPDDWSVFEDAHYPERESLSVSEIKSLISTCGYSCAAMSISKLGDFPSVECVSEECSTAEKREGVSLTVYVFPNIGDLTLNDFLRKALSKSPESDNFSQITLTNTVSDNVSQITLTNRLDVLKEVLRFEDGRRLHGFYFERDGNVYWLDEDVSSVSPQEHRDLVAELDSIIAAIEFLDDKRLQ